MGTTMDIKSVEFSAAFVNSLGGSGKCDANDILDSIALEVSKGPIDPTAPLATDNGVVGRVIISLENGSTTAFALKRNSD